jgi:hypothetical protein
MQCMEDLRLLGSRDEEKFAYILLRLGVQPCSFCCVVVTDYMSIPAVEGLTLVLGWLEVFGQKPRGFMSTCSSVGVAYPKRSGRWGRYRIV